MESKTYLNLYEKIIEYNNNIILKWEMLTRAMPPKYWLRGQI